LSIATYKKVANAIEQLDFEVTEENALGLGKGKTKVDGIGKGSAEKIHEFLTTGNIEKLQDKKAGLGLA
jgi:poly [ADP-ribose] polymerase